MTKKGNIQKSETPDFRVRNKSMTLKKEIVNIAAHKGLGYSAFLRSEIIKIRDNAPAEHRIAPSKD